MKEISLTQGQVALVDDEDYDYLMQWKWYARNSICGYYAMRSQHEPRVKGRKDVCKTILMHRVILQTPEGMDVDHKDFNGLNNQKENIRNCTRSQNIMHRMAWSNCAYKGVLLRKRNKYVLRYTASICYNKTINLGSFPTAELAARAYDIAAIKFFGEFAETNFDKALYISTDIDREYDMFIENKEKYSWNKGLTKESNDVLLKMGNTRKGTVAWNRGLTKDTDERVANYSSKLLGVKKTKRKPNVKIDNR